MAVVYVKVNIKIGVYIAFEKHSWCVQVNQVTPEAPSEYRRWKQKGLSRL